jgi:dTMP kinase
VGLLRPDCTLLVDVDVDAVAQRGGYGEERYERVDFQRCVHSTFHQMAQEDQKGAWLIIDGMRTKDAVHADIFAAALKVIQDAAGAPLHDNSLFRS